MTIFFLKVKNLLEIIWTTITNFIKNYMHELNKAYSNLRKLSLSNFIEGTNYRKWQIESTKLSLIRDIEFLIDQLNDYHIEIFDMQFETIGSYLCAKKANEDLKTPDCAMEEFSRGYRNYNLSNPTQEIYCPFIAIEKLIYPRQIKNRKKFPYYKILVFVEKSNSFSVEKSLKSIVFNSMGTKLKCSSFKKLEKEHFNSLFYQRLITNCDINTHGKFVWNTSFCLYSNVVTLEYPDNSSIDTHAAFFSFIDNLWSQTDTEENANLFFKTLNFNFGFKLKNHNYVKNTLV